MPSIGEIQRESTINPNTKWRRLYMWVACPICGKQRWVRCTKTRKLYTGSNCFDCSRRLKRPNQTGELCPSWKGGKTNCGRYFRIWIKKVDFYAPMIGFDDSTYGGYAYEHRLVMAKHLGRCLQRWEIVHHKNGDTRDNRIENLELTTLGSHTIEHNMGYKDGYRKGFMDGKDARIKQLQFEIERFRKQEGMA